MKSITVTGNSGDVTVTKNTDGTYSFTMPDEDVTVAVTFANQYDVMVSTTSNVYGYIAPEKTSYYEGQTVTLKMIDTSKVLNKVTLNCDSASVSNFDPDTLTFTMPAGNVTIGGKLYGENYHYITVNTVGGDNTCTVALSITEEGEPLSKIGGKWYATKDTKVSITAGGTGYASEVSGSVAISKNSFTMPDKNVILTVTFTKQYAVTIADGSKDYMTVDSTMAVAGKEVKVKPKSNYRLDTLTVTEMDGDGTVDVTKNADGTYTFTMPAYDVTVAATATKLYAVVISGTDIGSITTNASAYAAGDTVTLTLPAGKVFAALEASYTLNNFTEKLTISNGSFTMPAADVKVTAEVVDGYTVTVNVVGENLECGVECYNLSNAYDGSYYSKEGTTISLLLTYDRKTYRCTLVVKTAEGADVSSAINSTGAYSFTMPKENVTVTVTFSEIATSYTITIPSAVSLNSASSMTITASDVANLNGASITVKATSENGGKLVCGDASIVYSFTESMSFTKDGEESLDLIVTGTTDGKPAGTYSDTLTFAVALTSPVAQ